MQRVSKYLKIADFFKDLESKYNVELTVQKALHGYRISKIVIPKEKRGEGLGSKVMKTITNWADTNKQLLMLTPSKDFGATSVSRLKDFYKQFGFVENKGRNKNFQFMDTMYRDFKK